MRRRRPARSPNRVCRSRSQGRVWRSRAISSGTSRRAVREGLPEDAAIRALTIEAAKIAGAADRVGSLEKGKIANVIVTSGDLFNEATRIRYVFVDGRMVNIDTAEATGGRGGRGRGGR